MSFSPTMSEYMRLWQLYDQAPCDSDEEADLDAQLWALWDQLSQDEKDYTETRDAVASIKAAEPHSLA